MTDWQMCDMRNRLEEVADKLNEAQNALAEAQRLNPKLTVKWEIEHGPGIPAVLDGLRKAGLPEE